MAGAARHDAARFVLGTWIASRFLFLAAGALAARVLPPAVPVGEPREPPGVLNYWAHWDGGWYASIAEHGYHGTGWPVSAAFFPVYPMLLRAGTLLGGGVAIWGVVISLVASLFTLYFVYAIADDMFDRRVARAATAALAFFPTAFFLNAVYTEAVFLAVATGAVWAARVQGNLWLAGVLGCGAAGTRNIGVFLVFPLLHEWLRRRERAGWRGLVAISFVPLGLVGYMFWLWRWASDPLLFKSMQEVWGRTIKSPIDTVSQAWSVAETGAGWAVRPLRVFGTDSPNPSFAAMDTFNFVFFGLLVVLLVGCIARAPRGMALYALCAGTLPILTPAGFAPLASLPRYLLAVFPAFIVLGLVLSRSRVLLAVWLASSAALGVLFAFFFTTWRWVA